MRHILGISCFRDSENESAAVALLQDGIITQSASENLFSRTVVDARFPENALQWVLNAAQLKPQDLSSIVYFRKPFAQFDYLLKKQFQSWPFAFKQFQKFVHHMITKELRITSLVKKHVGVKPPISFVHLHESIAGASFYTSPFDEAAVLVFETGKPDSDVTIYHGKDTKLFPVSKLKGLFDKKEILNYCRYAIKTTKSHNLCLPNRLCMGLADLYESNIIDYDHIFFCPTSTNLSLALGSALYKYHAIEGLPRTKHSLKNLAIGPSYTHSQISEYIVQSGLPAKEYKEKELFEKTTTLLAQQKLVGWFQEGVGADDISLGHRNIIASIDAKSRWGKLLVSSDAVKVLSSNESFDGLLEKSSFFHNFWSYYLESKKEQSPLAILPLASKDIPLANTPQNAYQCFVEFGLDALIMDSFIIERSDLPWIRKM